MRVLYLTLAIRPMQMKFTYNANDSTYITLFFHENLRIEHGGLGAIHLFLQL